MSEDLGVSAVPEKTPAGKPAPKAEKKAGPLFGEVVQGRALVLIPEDLIARRDAQQLLEDALTTPGARTPRVFTSLNLKKLDESFAIYTAVTVKRRGETKLQISPAVLCGNHTTTVETESLGDDIDLGVTSEPVKVLDHPSIVNSLQRGTGPAWRVAFANGSIRLLNT